MIELESMAIAMPEVEGHPNREPFHGVLTVVDVPSQKAPSGSKGHPVLLTRAAAEAALPSLLGMALDYAPSFDRHDMQRKVGVITQADVVGKNVEIGGYLFAKDFPEVVQRIASSGRRGYSAGAPQSSQSKTFRARSLQAGSVIDITRREIKPVVAAKPSPETPASKETRWKGSLSTLANRLLHLTIALRGGQPEREEEDDETQRKSRIENLHAEGGELGMSYEVTAAEVSDTRARVWTLTSVIFTGAAILRRDKAAYRDTWIELGS